MPHAQAAAAVSDVARAAKAALADGLLGAAAHAAEKAAAAINSPETEREQGLFAKGLSGLASSGVGAFASWASQTRETVLEDTKEEESEATRVSRAERLAYFTPELELLGVHADEAAGLDERALRNAFRERSRRMHPDANGGVPANEDDVYHLNQAYETLRKLL